MGADAATPFSLARAMVFIMVTGSPAWKPQATFAVVTWGMSASSAPMTQLPKLSPQSMLMSNVPAMTRPPRQTLSHAIMPRPGRGGKPEA